MRTVKRLGEVVLQRNVQLERLAGIAEVGSSLPRQLAGLVKRDEMRPNRIATLIRGDESERREHTRRLRDEHGADAQLLGELARV